MAEFFNVSGAEHLIRPDNIGADIIVDVGAGHRFITINQALEYLSGVIPIYNNYRPYYINLELGYIMANKSYVNNRFVNWRISSAIINLKSGFTMSEQVIVDGWDLSWIKIISEDDVVPVTWDVTSLNTRLDVSSVLKTKYVYNNHRNDDVIEIILNDRGNDDSVYALFSAGNGGRHPVVCTKFHMPHGIFDYGAYVIGAGSSIIFKPIFEIFDTSGSEIRNAGVIGADVCGLLATKGAVASIDECEFYDSETSICASLGATISAQYADISGTDSIYSYNGGNVCADNAIGGGTAIAEKGSKISMNETSFRPAVIDGSTISAHGSVGIDQCTNRVMRDGIIFANYNNWVLDSDCHD